MSTDANKRTRPLPAHANPRHLKDQAKDLVKSGTAATLSGAQLRLARLYGFSGWPKLRARSSDGSGSGCSRNERWGAPSRDR